MQVVIDLVLVTVIVVARYHQNRVGLKVHRERYAQRKLRLVPFLERCAGWFEIRCLMPGIPGIISVGYTFGKPTSRLDKSLESQRVQGVYIR